MAGHCGEQERLSGAGAGGRLLQARVLQAQAHLRLRVALEVGDAAALDKDVPTAARRAGAGGGYILRRTRSDASKLTVVL